jgi:hypothetical protein
MADSWIPGGSVTGQEPVRGVYFGGRSFTGPEWLRWGVVVAAGLMTFGTVYAATPDGQQWSCVDGLIDAASVPDMSTADLQELRAEAERQCSARSDQ